MTSQTADVFDLDREISEVLRGKIQPGPAAAAVAKTGVADSPGLFVKKGDVERPCNTSRDIPTTAVPQQYHEQGSVVSATSPEFTDSRTPHGQDGTIFQNEASKENENNTSRSNLPTVTSTHTEVNSHTNARTQTNQVSQVNLIDSTNAYTSQKGSQFEQPIPTKPSSLAPYCYDTTTSMNTPSSLEKLVNDCFLQSIDQLFDTARLEMVGKFQAFLNKLHCSENLSFLVAAYKYEHYYETIFPVITHPEHRVNRTPSPSVRDIYGRKAAHQKVSHRNRSFSRGSSKSMEDGNAMFVSTIDDLETPSMSQAWSDLRSANLDSGGVSNDEDDFDNDSDNDLVFDTEIETCQQDCAEALANNLDSLTPADRDLLTSNWYHIISTYIFPDSPEQINLSQKLTNEILEEDRSQKVHHPCVLRRASREVMQLLQENVYADFRVSEGTNFGSSSTLKHEMSEDHSICGAANDMCSSSISINRTCGGASAANSASKAGMSKSLSGKYGPRGSMSKHGASSDGKSKKRFARSTKEKTERSNSDTQTSTPKLENGRIINIQQGSLTPTDLSSSASPSSSSLTNLFGHLKLHTYHTHTPSPPPSSNLGSLVHSLAGSPLAIEKEESMDKSWKEDNGMGSLKFWNKRKH